MRPGSTSGRGLEEVEGGLDVTTCRPASPDPVGVTVAVALTATVEEQDAVAVLDQHPRVRLRVGAARGRRSPRRRCRGRHVPALEGADRRWS